MKIKKITRHSIEYPKLRGLWCEVFGDEPEYVDAFYDNFGQDAWGYVLEDADGVQAALTCFRMGEVAGAPVIVSYAICTRGAARGKGYGGAITCFARDEVVSGGCISMLAPAEESLVDFYKRLGYKATGWSNVTEGQVPCHQETAPISQSGVTRDLSLCHISALCRISAEEYFALRERMLSTTPHVRLSEAAMRWADSECDGFYRSETGASLSDTPDGALPSGGFAIRAEGAEFLPECAHREDYMQAMSCGHEQIADRIYLGFTFD